MTVITHTDVATTLAERGARYGSFEDHATTCQALMRVMRGAHDGQGWAKQDDDQRQALTVIADKIARMLNGDPTYRDNWHDIVGYAKLVDARMLRDAQRNVETAPPRREIVYKPTKKGVELSHEDYSLLLKEAGRA